MLFVLFFLISLFLFLDAAQYSRKTTCTVEDVTSDLCITDSYSYGDKYTYTYSVECRENNKYTFTKKSQCKSSAGQRFDVGKKRRCWTNNGCNKKPRFVNSEKRRVTAGILLGVAVVFVMPALLFAVAWGYGKKHDAFAGGGGL